MQDLSLEGKALHERLTSFALANTKMLANLIVVLVEKGLIDEADVRDRLFPKLQDDIEHLKNLPPPDRQILTDEHTALELLTKLLRMELLPDTLSQEGETPAAQ